jgi:hypothetical protein
MVQFDLNIEKNIYYAYFFYEILRRKNFGVKIVKWVAYHWLINSSKTLPVAILIQRNIAFREQNFNQKQSK